MEGLTIGRILKMLLNNQFSDVETALLASNLRLPYLNQTFPMQQVLLYTLLCLPQLTSMNFQYSSQRLLKDICYVQESKNMLEDLTLKESYHEAKRYSVARCVERVPNELWKQIFSYLPTKAVLSVGLVSKRWYGVFVGSVARVAIPRYRNQLMKQFINLTSINTELFSDNDTTRFFGQISNLSSLSSLFISTGKLITEIDTRISTMTQLKKFSLKSYGSISCPDLVNNTNLQVLIIQGIADTIPQEYSVLQRLISLHLDNNKLTELPLMISNFSNLSTLNVAENSLTVIPPQINKLIGLEHLYLHDNNIQELPDEITNLVQLKLLGLSGNKICELPSGMSALTQLLYLSLNENKLSEISESVMSMTQLELLQLCSNEIGSIPKNISNLTKLVCLALDDNKFTGLPQTFTILTNLEYLGLRETKLTRFQVDQVSNALQSVPILSDFGGYNEDEEDKLLNLIFSRYLWL